MFRDLPRCLCADVTVAAGGLFRADGEVPEEAVGGIRRRVEWRPIAVHDLLVRARAKHGRGDRAREQLSELHWHLPTATLRPGCDPGKPTTFIISSRSITTASPRS